MTKVKVHLYEMYIAGLNPGLNDRHSIAGLNPVFTFA